MVNLSTVWAVEYSPTTKQYHIELLNEIVDNNTRAYLGGGFVPDFVIVGVAPSHLEATALLAALKETRTTQP